MIYGYLLIFYSIKTNAERQLSKERPRLLCSLQRHVEAGNVAQNAPLKHTKYSRMSHS